MRAASRLGTDLLTRLAITLSLGIAACLALAAALSMPEGIHAARTIAAADNPVRLTELALDKNFTAPVATREIEEALAAGDTELARSFVDLAAERAVAIPPALIEKTKSAERHAAMPSSKAPVSRAALSPASRRTGRAPPVC